MTLKPDIQIRGNTVDIELMYPRSDNHQSHVEVGLCDVRAADSIRIHYDFDRDGWSIEQASTFQWESNDAVCDPDWQEVAFVQAWARDKEPLR